MLLNLVVPPLSAQDDPQAPPGKSEEKATPARGDSVRIDHTGIHVGGEDPVDINIPNAGGGMFGGKDPLSPTNGPFLVSIISVVMIFGMPVAIVGIALYFKHRRNRMLHETLRAMVEKGVPIPPELISGRGLSSAKAANVESANVESRGNKDLRAGLVLIAVGTGVLMLPASFSKLGLIPLFIGVALLVVWLIALLVNKRKNTLAQ